MYHIWSMPTAHWVQGSYQSLKKIVLNCAVKEYYLIPTSEVPLTNSVRDKILDPEALPIKVTAHTPVFG